MGYALVQWFYLLENGMNTPYLFELNTACMRVATRWKDDTFLSEAMKDIPAAAIPMVLHQVLEAEENNDDHWHLTLDAPPKTQALRALVPWMLLARCEPIMQKIQVATVQSTCCGVLQGGAIAMHELLKQAQCLPVALHASFVVVLSLMVWQECRENLFPLLPTDEYDRLAAMPLPLYSHSSIPGLVETYCPNLYPYLSLVLGPHDWDACTVRTLAREMRNAEHLNDVVPLPKMDMD